MLVAVGLATTEDGWSLIANESLPFSLLNPNKKVVDARKKGSAHHDGLTRLHLSTITRVHAYLPRMSEHHNDKLKTALMLATAFGCGVATTLCGVWVRRHQAIQVLEEPNHSPDEKRLEPQNSSSHEQQQESRVFWQGPPSTFFAQARTEKAGSKKKNLSSEQGLKQMFMELRCTDPEGRIIRDDKNLTGAEGEAVDSPHGFVTIESFVNALKGLQLDLSKREMQRVYDEVDPQHTGRLTYSAFCRGWRRNRLLQTIVSDYANPHIFSVAEDYDFTAETYRNLSHPDYKVAPNNQWGTSGVQMYSEDLHGNLVGDYIEARRRVDYSYHTNYTEERQLWQDKIVADVAVRMHSQDRPWLVTMLFTNPVYSV